MSGIQEYYYSLRQMVHLNLQVPVYSESTFENSNVDLPCIVFTREGILGTQTMSGPSVRTETTTWSCKSKTIEEAEDMRDFLISILNGYNNGEIQMVINSEIDDFDISTGIYSRDVSFDVVYGADIIYYNAIIGAGKAGQVAVWEDKYILTGSNAMAITGSNISFYGDVFISGSLTISGAFNSESSSFATSASYAITSSATTLQADIVPNQNVGGIISGITIHSGSTIESVLRTMLIAYTPPTLSSLSMRFGGSTISTATRDVNNSFQVNTASFTATLDSNGVGPISSSWTASGADIGTVSYYFGNAGLSNGSNILSVGNTYTINRATSGGTVTFTVNGKRSDIGTAITGASTSVSFRFRNYMAASSTDIISNATAQTVIDNDVVDSILDSDRSWTATCNGNNDTLGNFTYIIYPASYGDLSTIIQNGALPVLTAFTKLGDYTINNAYGASVSVRVYKSNSDKAFASGTTLAIS